MNLKSGSFVMLRFIMVLAIVAFFILGCAPKEVPSPLEVPSEQVPPAVPPLTDEEILTQYPDTLDEALEELDLVD